MSLSYLYAKTSLYQISNSILEFTHNICNQGLAIAMLNRAQFHKACKHEHLLSPGTDALLIFCLAPKFAKQYFLVNSYIKLGLDPIALGLQASLTYYFILQL